ncbi:MAG TPA: Hsp20/alpha crystallin family protein [Ignavibacteriaceae bacterium]|nr:Hsp20/alpha crystallin family protein [Ignavibacteriaceae bacterium]
MTQNKELMNINRTPDFDWQELVSTQNYVNPFVDIFETDEDYILTANMPGIERENIKLKIEGDSLIIFGKIDFEKQLSRKYILNENEIGNYFRKFNISDSVDKSKINAKYENGQLIIKLPKNEKMKPINIDIM